MDERIANRIHNLKIELEKTIVDHLLTELRRYGLDIDKRFEQALRRDLVVRISIHEK